MPDIIKVGLTGRMKSGKGVVSEYLTNRHGFRKQAFADPVKMASVVAINAALGHLGRPQIMTLERLERDKSILRPMPQFIGTNLGRVYLGDPNIWIDMLLGWVEDYESMQLTLGESIRIVVDDCRFQNEAEALRRAGFLIVKIVRPVDDRIHTVVNDLLDRNRNMTWSEAHQEAVRVMEHDSEVEVDSIIPDITLPNSGTLDDLLRGVSQMAINLRTELVI